MAKLPTMNEPGSTPIQVGSSIDANSSTLNTQAIVQGTSKIANALINDARDKVRSAQNDYQSRVLEQTKLMEQQRLLQADQEIRIIVDSMTKKMSQDAQRGLTMQDPNAITNAVNNYVKKNASKFSNRGKLALQETAIGYSNSGVSLIDKLNISVQENQINNTIDRAHGLALQNLTDINKIPSKDDYYKAVKEMKDTYTSLGFKGSSLDAMLSKHEKDFGNMFYTRLGGVADAMSSNMEQRTAAATRSDQIDINGYSQGISLLMSSIAGSKDIPADFEKKSKILSDIRSQASIILDKAQKQKDKLTTYQNIIALGGIPGDTKTIEAFDKKFIEFASDNKLPVDPNTNILMTKLKAPETLSILDKFQRSTPTATNIPTALANQIKNNILNPKSEEDFINGISVYKTIMASPESNDLSNRNKSYQLTQAFTNSFSESELTKMSVASVYSDFSNDSNAIREVVNNLKTVTKKDLETAKEFRYIEGNNDNFTFAKDVLDKVDIDMPESQKYAFYTETNDYIDNINVATGFKLNKDQLIQIATERMKNKYVEVDLKDSYWFGKKIAIANYGFPVDSNKFEQQAISAFLNSSWVKEQLDKPENKGIKITDSKVREWVSNNFTVDQINADIKDINGAMVFKWIDERTGFPIMDSKGERIQFVYQPDIAGDQLKGSARNTNLIGKTVADKQKEDSAPKIGTSWRYNGL